MIGAVAEMDLEQFYAGYRADGHGRAADEPSVMVTLILYAFATNVRSSRATKASRRLVSQSQHAGRLSASVAAGRVGEGRWTDYGAELARRTTEIIANDL